MQIDLERYKRIAHPEYGTIEVNLKKGLVIRIGNITEARHEVKKIK